MKKSGRTNKAFFVLIAVIAVFIAALTIAGCDDIRRQPSLPSPDLRLTGNYTVEWSAVSGAKGYNVSVVDITSDVPSQLKRVDNYSLTSLSLLEFAGNKSVKVKVEVSALSGSDDYSDSAVARLDVTIPPVKDLSMVSYANDHIVSVTEQYKNSFSSADFVNYAYYPVGDADLTVTRSSNIASVSAQGDYSTNFSVRINANYFVLPKSYMSQFSAGAVIPLSIVYKDGKTSTFSVYVVDKVPPAVQNLPEEGYFVYAEGSELALSFAEGVRVYNVSVDGRTVPASTNTIMSKQTVTLTSSALAGQEEGFRLLTLYTDSGAVNVPLLYLPQYDCAPSDLRLDVDSYPRIYVRWDSNLAAERYEVSVNGEIYTSLTHPNLFTSESFDITDIISVTDGITDEITVTAYIPRAYDDNDCRGDEKAYSVSLSAGDYSSFIPYLTDTFYYVGQTYNYYVDDESEWDAFVGYTALCYDELESTGRTYNGEYEYKKVKVAVTMQDYNERSIASSKYKEGIAAFREVVSYKVEVSLVEPSVYELVLLHTSQIVPSKNADALGSYFTDMNSPSYTVSGEYLHYSDTGRSGAYDGFAINAVEQTALVTNSEELYFAVEAGYRPVFAEESDSNSAYRIYNKAKTVLRRIIDDGMSDYDKVHAIYDFLTGEVIYDYAVANYSSTVDDSQDKYNDVYKYNCFFLEGVFDDGVAVCNGLAKAFVLMCGIEGIDSIKIQGDAGGRHAWNKVEIDGMWYVVDTTWGCSVVNTGGTKYSYSEHDYLLVDQHSLTGRTEDKDVLGSDIYAGGAAYDPYANMLYVKDGSLHDHIASTEQEYADIIDYYTSENYWSTNGRSFIIYVRYDNKFTSSFISKYKNYRGYTLTYIVDTVNSLPNDNTALIIFNRNL